jgi:hypothetical protein
VPFIFCLECPALTDTFERGWRGYLTDDEFQPAEVTILCPACSAREFGAPPLADSDQAD